MMMDKDKLITKQQTMIRQLLNFTQTTTDAHVVIRDQLQAAIDAVNELEEAHQNLRVVVQEFLEENEPDPPTAGGTG